MLKDKLFEYSEDLAGKPSQDLAKIWTDIDVEKLLKPTNSAELKECFVKEGGFFNPEFKYDTEAIEKCRGDLNLIIQELSNILVNIRPLEVEEDEDEESSRARFINHLLFARINEALCLEPFLEEVLNGTPEKAAGYLARIYSSPDREIVRFAKEVAANGWHEVYEDIEQYTAINAKKREQMRKHAYSAESAAQLFRTALLRLLKEQIMCCYFNNNGGFEAKVGDYNKVDTLFEDGKSVIVIPEGCSIDGEELLALIGREVEGHFRTMAVTRTILSKMIGKGSPLASIVPILAKDLDESNYHGFARNSYVYVKGLSGLPEPFLTLAVDYARRKHSFAETAEYIYRCCLKFGLDKTEAREKTWDATEKAFLGQSNTRKLVGYAFLKAGDELEGFLKAGSMTENEFFYLENLAALEPGELQYACIGGWLDDNDLTNTIDCSVDIIDYMSTFF